MGRNIFITRSPVPPSRWRQVFPDAEMLPEIPDGLSAGTLVWLHNLMPAQVPAHVRQAGVRFIVMEDRPSDEAGLSALSQGASGYCNAHAAPELLHDIEAVVRNQGLWVGESLLNRLISGISMRAPSRNMENHPALDALSERERDVAVRIARGESNKEIARDLSVAERTIKAHLSNIFDKLGVRDRLQLALVLATPRPDKEP